MLAVEPIHARLPRQRRQRHHAAHHVQCVNHHQRKCNTIDTHPQRLVVVVSHVPELRERIEDLIVLDKDPVTGDSIVVGGKAL